MSSDSESDSEHSNSLEKNQHEITLDEEFSSSTEAYHLDDYVHTKYDNNRYIRSLLQSADLEILILKVLAFRVKNVVTHKIKRKSLFESRHLIINCP